MRIGLDFDNTIVNYDAIFRDVAVDVGYFPSTYRGGKRDVRESLRAQPSGEERWQRVQALAYGPRLVDAQPFAGVEQFVARCRQLAIPLFVISHKSERAAAAPEGTDLRKAASAWLEARFGAEAFDGVFFEDTRASKVARIAGLRCTHLIDDLAEVFAEPAFPAGVARWLFDPDGDAEADDVERFGDWNTLLLRVEEERSLHDRVARLLDRGTVTLTACRGGANNRVYRAQSTDGHRYAIKSYGERDERGRLQHEFAALSFLTRHGVEEVPKPVTSDREHGLGAYEWVEGDRVGVPSTADIRAAVAFVERLDALRDEPGAAGLPVAADAATSAPELWKQIEERRSRLAGVAPGEPQLAAFLERFDAQAERLRPGETPRGTAELPPEFRTLSPSDFGFHNALRRAGKLVFLDFEYFGWDDPVKLAADFVMHPGMNLTSADSKEWLGGLTAIYRRDPDFPARLRRFAPILALKWCLIILNEFLPAAWARRVASGRHRAARPAKAEQLAKAEALLFRISRDEPIDGLD